MYDGETQVGEMVLPESNAAEVERSVIKSFRPVEVTMPEEHAYVDLGMPSGLLWATCNVGAASPEEYGDYFAWGEIEPKDVYSQSTYLFWNGTWDDCYDGYGYTTLSSYHDAATVNWDSWNWSNNLWRMPTKEEWQELYNNTTVTWTQQNGVNGRLFTASNGNSLFLPAAGYRNYGSLYNAGSDGDYWSSSLYTYDPNGALYFDFYSDYCNLYGGYRYLGFSVRPVREN